MMGHTPGPPLLGQSVSRCMECFEAWPCNAARAWGAELFAPTADPQALWEVCARHRRQIEAMRERIRALEQRANRELRQLHESASAKRPVPVVEGVVIMNGVWCFDCKRRIDVSREYYNGITETHGELNCGPALRMAVVKRPGALEVVEPERTEGSVWRTLPTSEQWPSVVVFCQPFGKETT